MFPNHESGRFVPSIVVATLPFSAFTVIGLAQEEYEVSRHVRTRHCPFFSYSSRTLGRAAYLEKCENLKF